MKIIKIHYAHGTAFTEHVSSRDAAELATGSGQYHAEATAVLEFNLAREIPEKLCSGRFVLVSTDGRIATYKDVG